MTPPQPHEYAPFYANYVRQVVDSNDILSLLEIQIQEMASLLRSLGEEQGMYRYAPDKWSLKQLIGHINDTERIFAYRILRIARGDTQALAGFEQDDYVATSPAEKMPITDLLAEFTTLRQANLLMIHHLDTAAWQRQGTASGASISVNALIYILAGHVAHHLNIVKERYL